MCWTDALSVGKWVSWKKVECFELKTVSVSAELGEIDHEWDRLSHSWSLSSSSFSLSMYLLSAYFYRIFHHCLLVSWSVLKIPPISAFAGHSYKNCGAPDEWPQETTQSRLPNQKADHAANTAFNSITRTSTEHPFLHAVSVVCITRCPITACTTKPCTQYKRKGSDMVTL